MVTPNPKVTFALTGLTPVEKVFCAVVVDTTTRCWNWTRRLDRDGYGSIHHATRGNMGAHRFSWFAFKGPIPDGLETDHLCRNRACVNPDHLELVTHGENVRRAAAAMNGERRSRAPRRWANGQTAATHCAKGHEFTPENTGRQKSGRLCLTCCRERKAAAYKLAKGA